jgi:endonuclease/exonuclease/phosphatase family metal-dependent hydrolase
MDAVTALLAIRVLTFNAAGIPLVHPGVARRMRDAGRAIADGGYDIAGLQELWFDRDSAALARASGLAHAARTPRSAAFGTGLTILSRWPVTLTEERAFTAVRPSLRHPLEGEAAAGKGFLLARIATPWGELDAYAAHTLADYDEARYHLLRLTELFELAEFARERSRGRPFVILGDLNSGHGDREYDLFLDLLGLRDLCAPSGRELCADERRPKRIDHILTPGGSALGRRTLDANMESLDLRLSDHVGFAADLPPAFMALRAKPDPKRRAAALLAVEEAMRGAMARLSERKRARAWIPFYGAFLSARYERQAARFAAIGERARSARLSSVGGDDARVGHEVVPAAALRLPESP